MSLYRSSVDAIVRICTSSPYFLLPEQHPIWQAFLGVKHKRAEVAGCGVPPKFRHLASVLRRLGSAVADAQAKRICRYCWVPEASCFCDLIRRVGSESDSALFDAAVTPVMCLHADEFLRVTNSGHIAAISLDAPLVIWGLPSHDAILQNLARLHVDEYEFFFRTTTVKKAADNDDDDDDGTAELKGGDDTAAIDASRKAGADFPSLIVKPPTMEEIVAAREQKHPNRPPPVVGVLYPHQTAVQLEEFVAKNSAVQQEEANARERDEVEKVENASGAAVAAERSGKQQPNQQTSPIILVLLDATWSGAHRLNLHIPADVPRIVINIDADFGRGRFASLRKRTRETGCSTLEATTMALSQLLAAKYPPSSAPTQTEDDHISARVENIMYYDMQLFCDIVVAFKHLPPSEVKSHVFSTDPEIVAAVERCCGESLRTYWLERNKEIVEAKVDRGEVQMSFEDLSRKGLMCSPLARYCYVCKKYINFSRMVEHCGGQQHIDAWAAKMELAKAKVVAESSSTLSDDEIHAAALQTIWQPSEIDIENGSRERSTWNALAPAAASSKTE